MFTQLDLFGDLPAPEKPSTPSQRTEKKSTARSGNTGSSTQPTQAQLSMGLPEDGFPEPSRNWTTQEDVQKTRLTEGLQTDPANLVESETETFIQKAVELTEPLNPTEKLDQPSASDPSAASELSDAQRGANKIQSLTSRTAPEIPEESRAEKGRRYYIQTEIPADPPLAAKPPGPEILMAGLISSRNTAQEPRLKYIQTEIPSDLIEPAFIAVKASDAGVTTDAGAVKTSSNLPIPPEPDASTPAAPVLEKKEKIRHEIPEAALRRTRPLMPPKVIMADPEWEKEGPSNREAVDALDNSTRLISESSIDIPATTDSTSASINEKDLSDAQVSRQETVVPSMPDPVPAPETVMQSVQASTRRKKDSKEAVIDNAGAGVPADEQLNARQYYSIGEVATMFNVKTSLLRYWESEFDMLKLRKNRKGDRFFRPDDIKSLQLIHHLLKEKKYTIEGAREYMRNAGKMKEKFETIETLQRIRQFLVEMRNGLQIERIQDNH
jgi:DNA-binding transcriptional MerR regulator